MDKSNRAVKLDNGQYVAQIQFFDRLGVVITSSALFNYTLESTEDNGNGTLFLDERTNQVCHASLTL